LCRLLCWVPCPGQCWTGVVTARNRLTPFLTGMLLLFIFLWMTWHVYLLYNSFMMFINLVGTPRSVSVCHIAACFRESKALSKSTNYNIEWWAIFERLFDHYSHCVNLVDTGPVWSEAGLLFPQ
jgi:hypothetical protein